MKTVLITGGAGFIGSYLCQQFLEQNYRVICVDNFITGQKKNIITFINKPNFQLIEEDICRPSFYQKIAPFKLSYILHFASPAGPNPHSSKSYLKFPVETYLVNSYATHLLLELAKKNNADFVFASTSEVYGNPLKHPQKENYFGNVNTLGPRSCYDESKRFGEMAAFTFGKLNKINAKIVRIFNTYGPRMNPDDGRVIPRFIIQALKNKPISIYGDGKQTRCFCFINDLIEGILKIVLQAKSYTVYNLGNDKEITINKLAKIIINLTQSQSKIILNPLPQDDPERRKPDLTKITKDLGWRPKTSLEKGLKKTIAFFSMAD